MKTICFITTISTILVINSISMAAIQSANYRIEPAAFSSAGGTSTSTSYSMSFTLGQGTAIGGSSSSSYALLAGFWYQLQELMALGDIDGDNDVDLYDVILGLKVLSGETINGITTNGDVNNDSKIGLEEILYDLDKTSQ